MQEQEVVRTTDEIFSQQEVQQISPVMAFLKTKWRLLAIVAAAVVILAVVLIFVLGGNSPESVALKYVEAELNGDEFNAREYMAYDYCEFLLEFFDCDEDEFFEKMSDSLGEDIESWEDYGQVLRDQAKEELEDEYGDYEITMEVTRVKDSSVKKIKEVFLLESLEDDGLIDRDDFKDIKEVTVKVKISGEDETDRETLAVFMVQLGSLWKVLTAVTK